MNYDFGFVWEILPSLLRATRITLLATVGGMALALAIGLGLAILRRSRLRLVRTVGSGYVEFIRNTPFLIQLYFVFYVLPEIGVRLPALATGIVCLGLNYAAYTSEVYRAGIDNVPAGQWEAALALHLPSSATWRDVVIPQAVRPMVPVFGNYLIGMFKETPLLSTITVVELFGAAQAVAGTTYRYFEPYTLVGIIFLLLSLPSAALVRLVERRLARGRNG